MEAGNINEVQKSAQHYTVRRALLEGYAGLWRKCTYIGFFLPRFWATIGKRFFPSFVNIWPSFLDKFDDHMWGGWVDTADNEHFKVRASFVIAG